MTASLTDLGPLFNYATAPHCGVETSRDAAESIKPQVNRLCSEVLRYIRSSPFGATLANNNAKLSGTGSMQSTFPPVIFVIAPSAVQIAPQSHKFRENRYYQHRCLL